MLNSKPITSRPASGWKLIQVIVAVFIALIISGVAHAAQESIENVIHVATQGHTAHADEHTEGGCCDLDGEHNCYGFQHNCNCCASGGVAYVRTLRTTIVVGEVTIQNLDVPGNEQNNAMGIRVRIDRPPRN